MEAVSVGPVWVVRAGEGGPYADEFERLGIVAIGWREAGRIGASEGDRQIDDKFAAAYPAWKEAARRMGAAQVRRFLRDIKVGDAVATYDPAGRMYLLYPLHGAAS